ncbi:rapid ALkalinization factor [Fusarium phyllophilum]|uniref:Rapid ALkalinization factor n=1 Tax=Fusarium phyllophilum TaxID=47803 RepID=A0A8H5I3M3_9HYPO|nr:rapid ALkalinization factor [Fusarium phyllophilum]
MKFSLITTLSLIGLAAAGPVQQKRAYISYYGLRRDGTPCSLRDESWQNCRPRAYAHDWSRGCEAVYQCRGDDYPPGPSS